MSHYRKTAIVRLVLPSGSAGQSLPLTADRAYGVFVTVDGKDAPAGYFRSPINDDQWRDFRTKLSSCNTVRPTVADPAADDLAFNNAMAIQGIGAALYKALGALNKEMQAFLDAGSDGGPDGHSDGHSDAHSEYGPGRRLVIQTQRTELHLLPWGAMCDGDGKLLAARDLSIVQAWDDFTDAQAVTKSRLTLTRVVGKGTMGATANALTDLLTQSGVIDICTQQDGDSTALDDSTALSGPDILHVEAHGNSATNQIGGVSSTTFAQRYGRPRIGLLWSCFSGAANSWGDSPALCLHRDGAAMVLSFQAELNVLDAAGLCQSFYSEVFGPAASRDPETALVHARCTKFDQGFQYACWASMTVYLRSPLDLSALPLNGPRVPKSQWAFAPQVVAQTTASSNSAVSELPFHPSASMYATPQLSSSFTAAVSSAGGAAADPTDDDSQNTDPAALDRDSDTTMVPGKLDDFRQPIEHAVCTMQPGSWKQMAAPPELVASSALLPVETFGGWRGNVIRLDGGDDPITQEILWELELTVPLNLNAAEKLVWFFKRIKDFGSPLIVWTNSQSRHMDFLKTISPSPALTFLLLTGPEPEKTLPELVDENRLDEARTFCESLPADTNGAKVSDEVLSAAYYACVRGAVPEAAKQYLHRLTSFQEWLLLTGNFYSRDDDNVLSVSDLAAFGERFLAGDDAAAREVALTQLRKPEDFYRLAMNQPAAASSPRETARAKHELGYLLDDQGQPGAAEMFYRMAVANLETCDDASEGSLHDSRWYFAMSAVLRDLADLLSGRKDRLREATALLKRAMAIQAFRGMQLQLAYSETTAARIALTDCRHTEAIDHALRAANRMEQCVNWSGWGKALGILFDSLAETRETARMISVANLATEKIRASNLSGDNIAKLARTFKFEKAKAHWIAGGLTEARDELEEIQTWAKPGEMSAMDREIDRLLTFLRVARPVAHKDAEIKEPTAVVRPARRMRKTSTAPATAVQ